MRHRFAPNAINIASRMALRFIGGGGASGAISTAAPFSSAVIASCLDVQMVNSLRVVEKGGVIADEKRKGFTTMSEYPHGPPAI